MTISRSNTTLFFLLALSLGPMLSVNAAGKSHLQSGKNNSNQTNSINTSVKSSQSLVSSPSSQNRSIVSTTIQQNIRKKIANKIIIDTKNNQSDRDEDTTNSNETESRNQSKNLNAIQSSLSQNSGILQKPKVKINYSVVIDSPNMIKKAQRDNNSESNQIIKSMVVPVDNKIYRGKNSGIQSKIKNLKRKATETNTSHRSTPLSLYSTKQSMVKLLKGEESTPCNKPLLTLFGVQGTLEDNSINSTPREKSYCRRNSQSCCSAFNINSTNHEFTKAATKLRKKFEVLEEMFALFKGSKFYDFISAHEDNGECKKHVQDMKITLGKQKYTFFDETYQMYQKEMMEMVLLDTEMYVKKNIWFYGDSICSICNPKIQDYFELSKQGSSLAVNINMCSERIEEREYEKNLLLIYERFVHNTILFVECVAGNEEDEEAENKSVNSNNNDKEVFEVIDEDQRNTFLITFDKCFLDKSVTEPECQQMCFKPLAWYQFPIDNLMHNYKVALAVLYRSMSDGEIAEYYDDIKEEEWKIQDENDPIYFYKVSNEWTEYKMEEITWTFHTATGHNVYREIMSKIYLNFESSKLISGLVVGLLAFLF